MLMKVTHYYVVEPTREHIDACFSDIAKHVMCFPFVIFALLSQISPGL